MEGVPGSPMTNLALRERSAAVENATTFSEQRTSGAPSGAPLCLYLAFDQSTCTRFDGSRLSRGFRERHAGFPASHGGELLHTDPVRGIEPSA